MSVSCPLPKVPKDSKEPEAKKVHCKYGALCSYWLNKKENQCRFCHDGTTIEECKKAIRKLLRDRREHVQGNRQGNRHGRGCGGAAPPPFP